MATSLIEAFALFDQRIRPSDTQKRRAVRRATRLSRALHSHPEISECYVVGSLNRSTIVRRFSDVDIVAIFNFRATPISEGSGALLELASTVVNGLSRAVGRNDSTITMRFSNWPDVDILPAIPGSRLDDPGSVRISARSGGWQTYSPHADDLLVADAVDRLGPSFKAVVRAFKWWSKSNGVVMPSFEIERLAYATFTEGIPELPQAVAMLFAAAAHSMDYGSSHREPGTGPPQSSDDREILRQAWAFSEEAQKALATADLERAGLIWRRLLGDVFPTVGS